MGICSDCNGKGKREQPCKKCGGKGRIKRTNFSIATKNEDGWEPCIYCRSRGINYVKCAACNGSGYK